MPAADKHKEIEMPHLHVIYCQT